MKKNVKKVAPSPRPMTKRQLSRHQRERRQRAIIFTVMGLVATIAVIVLAFGYWREFIRPGGQPIARVGETEISTRTLANVMGYYSSYTATQAWELQGVIADNQPAAETDEDKKRLVDAAGLRLQQMQALEQQISAGALDGLIEGEILRREAVAQGIVIDQADLDRALVSHYDLGLDTLVRALAGEEADEAKPPAEPSAAEVAAAQEKMRRTVDGGRIMSEAEFYRLIVEPEALRAKIEQQIMAAVPDKGEQVHARHILLETEAQANDALAMLKDGELDFESAAAQLSQDPGSKDEGGDLGWFPRGVMDPTFEMATFALEPGQLSDPVATQFGYHIILVEEKADEREIDKEMLDFLRSSAYPRWLAVQKSSPDSAVTYLVDAEKLRWAQNNVPKPPANQGRG